MQLSAPTSVQAQVIPALLSSEPQSLAFAAATGSGKTLAYVLPVLQQLKQQEVFDAKKRPELSRRPRAVILAPTRELAAQIGAVVKSLCHFIKLSSVVVTAGSGSYAAQRRRLDRPVDVVVATPAQLLRHVRNSNALLTGKHLRYVVLDEMDTMLEQGFSVELQQLLYPVLYHARGQVEPGTSPVESAPSVILTSATLTQTIQRMVGDANRDVQARRLYTKQTSDEKPPPLVLPRCQVIKAAGLHKAVPSLQQVFVDVGKTDKVSLLVDLLRSHASQQTMVFCNTAAACRAVEYALAEADVPCLSYHGGLNSEARKDNLQAFRRGGAGCLVCTDLAARGLDVPTVDHVVMFDFPLNAVDYLHRSGRTARGTNTGRVTALVARRDRVLATAIERAVQAGEPVDGLSSRKTDYQTGGRLDPQQRQSRTANSPPGRGSRRQSPKRKPQQRSSRGRPRR
jgi:superfamily II DNA/RNA helicase